ncbi:MAG: 30S ribosomal protein S8 [Rubinisphaera brasiliensis]|uniref:Small ribosomal subunit protein uS8 n=1 Tax=Rubinisphaera brasiliensis (strain ATCC 49424 / DSM 5305 / JCM 21570 / IAM 15109 / NBRC 103401 / IFAM 1448) TaxID=756272 RepID=F0SJ99_RUBBR|nr:30S ribosomal protein S8 [Rubinisphaera brasiliensis]ADY59674.1 SSU ribosomal protein S8P [Rubinisphaera brasiliensis DSM 5305]MBR9803436.1 30S ribosomal protein S8 [bacterium]
MMTDPVADMLTRIRNAIAIERPIVDMPSSRLKEGIADVLKREGYIWNYEVLEQAPQNVLRVQLKYGPNGERVIQKLVRFSKPGRRQYSGVKETPDVMQGMGICILSTSKGVLSNREAKAKGVGGEILCTVW